MTLKKPNPSLLLHLDHPIDWSNSQYFKNGCLTYDLYGEFIESEVSFEWQIEANEYSVWQFYLECFKLIQNNMTFILDKSVRDDLMACLKDTSSQFVQEAEEARDDILKLECKVSEILAAKKVSSWRRLAQAIDLRFGEFLCTLSSLLRRHHVTRGWAEDMFAIGDRIQGRTLRLVRHNLPTNSED